MIKEIAGYDGNYLIQDDGTVYSKRRQGCDGRILAQSTNSNGYLRVSLRNGPNKKDMLVHRLVAEAFLPKVEGREYINHKDGNKKNNCVDNLEWCTRSENMKHAFAIGLGRIPGLCGEDHPFHKVSDNDVVEIRNRYKEGESSNKIGLSYGISGTQVMNIVKYKQRKNVSERIKTMKKGA